MQTLIRCLSSLAGVPFGEPRVRTPDRGGRGEAAREQPRLRAAGVAARLPHDARRQHHQGKVR